MRPLVACFSRGFTALDRRLVQRGHRSIGGWVAGDVPVLLLTTVGRRTGREQTTLRLYHRRDDGSLLLIAANGTADWDPDWLCNLIAHPIAEIEIDGERRAVEATVLDDVDRNATWQEACRAFPGLQSAQAACRRAIPVVRLTVK